MIQEEVASYEQASIKTNSKPSGQKIASFQNVHTGI